MTNDERWKARYHEYIAFINENGRCPSKHREAETHLHSWYKHGRKLMNANMMPPHRLGEFKALIALAEAHRHVNQFQ